MSKILYIDDDRLIDTAKLEVDQRCTLAEAYKAFADEFVYDVVSLDGQMPFDDVNINTDVEYGKFVKKYVDISNRGRVIFSQWQVNDAKRHAGVYLLYLMKKFNYVPKIVIFHSFNYHLRALMEDIFKNMFYDQAVVMMFMDKRYIFDRESVELIPQAIEKHSKYFTNHKPEEAYVELRKGKNSFKITPDTIIFFKKDFRQSFNTDFNLPEFVKTKVAEGYEIVHGEEYIVDTSHMRGRDGTAFYGNMNFKVSPIHF